MGKKQGFHLFSADTVIGAYGIQYVANNDSFVEHATALFREL